MSPSKDSVKQWLRDHPDRDGRRWLASLCEVSKRTVDNWLSSPAAIPAKALVIIGRQMEADREAIRSRQPAPDQNLVLEVDPETFDQYNRAALSKGLIVRDWAVDTLNRAAERDVEDSKKFGVPSEAVESASIDTAEQVAAESEDSVGTGSPGRPQSSP